MKRKIIASTILLLLLLVVFVPKGKSEIQPYYSGEATSYKQQVIIGTTDSGSLELFKLENQKLEKFASLKAVNERFNTKEDFFDLEFKQIKGHLYVFAISKYSIYQYNISDLTSPKLTKKFKNNLWEWYNKIETFDGKIATISVEGVKIWNNDLITIDHYSQITNKKNADNIYLQDSKYFMFNIKGDKLTVFDKALRENINEIELNYKYEENTHVPYFNNQKNTIYVADDYHVKKYNLDGKLLAHFKHLNQPAYEVDSVNGKDIYFTNGIGIVKLDENLKVKTSKFTTNLGIPNSWAMGLQVVETHGEDKVVIFNNSNILVLDENLNTLDHYFSTMEKEKQPKEDLSLSLDRNQATPNAEVMLTGKGFLPNEELKIEFAKTKFSAQADANGRFETILTVPETRKAKRVAITVIGQDSNLNYSISFDIQ